MAYVGRFAPSPTGALHQGSLVAALASWLDARAHGGRWLVRIEDVDTPRCLPGAEATILAQLAACGLHPDETPQRQSGRTRAYQTALDRLIAQGWAYPCGCTRSEIEHVLAARGQARARHADTVYPGTCRLGLHGKPARAVRLLASPVLSRAPAALVIDWCDRRLGPQRQEVSRAVGDFILRRADGVWAYQLAVVLDDAAQGVTHVVRGADLADNTPRQLHLQRLLGLPSPRYFHAPVVPGPDGEKLSKQNGAAAVDTAQPLAALREAGHHLGLAVTGDDPAAWLSCAVAWWRERWASA